jgi:hypothetical protein
MACLQKNGPWGWACGGILGRFCNKFHAMRLGGGGVQQWNMGRGGYRAVAHLGMTQGSTARAKHAGKDRLAGLKNTAGGELTACTTRFKAHERLRI